MNFFCIIKNRHERRGAAQQKAKGRVGMDERVKEEEEKSERASKGEDLMRVCLKEER